MSKVIIYTDGASQGNPGDAAVGIVISDETGKVLREIGEYIGKETNNVAEYSALVWGLHEAAELGATEVEIRTDSELMARQLTGAYKVKSENLKPLYEEAISVLRCFRSVSISHVMREFNKRADELANEGIRKYKNSLKKSGPTKAPGITSPPPRRTKQGKLGL